MDIDYSQYTLPELEEVEISIDRNKFPERYETVRNLISLKSKEPACREYRNKVKNIGKFDTLWSRFLSMVIDLIVLSVLSSGLTFIASFLNQYFQTGLQIVDYFSMSLYAIILHALYGQTIGKFATDIKVVSIEGESEITLQQAILRDIVPIFALTAILTVTIVVGLNPEFFSENAEWVGKILAGLFLTYLAWNLIELVSMLFNKKRRSLQDYMASTVVIRLDHTD